MAELGGANLRYLQDLNIKKAAMVLELSEMIMVSGRHLSFLKALIRQVK